MTVLEPEGKDWWVFCRVIDNYGDAGVCWRLCCHLAQRGHRVTLFIDQIDLLDWMAPPAHRPRNIALVQWDTATDLTQACSPIPQVVIEAFACDLPDSLVQSMLLWLDQGRAPIWLNLEYLSAEPYVERSHLLPSPQRNGLRKTFFYPGWTAATGGLMRPYTEAKTASRDRPERSTWWQRFANQPRAVPTPNDLDKEHWVCLFCYEPEALLAMLLHLQFLIEQGGNVMRVWVCHGRSTEALQAALALSAELENLTPMPSGQSYLGSTAVHYLPPLCQHDFDALLQLCDVNFVRGEDSLAQAVQMGKPFVWHIYAQEDGAHVRKLEALLDALDLDVDSRLWHRWCNGLLMQADGALHSSTQPLQTFPQALPRAVAPHLLCAVPDLVSELECFVHAQTARV